MQRSILLAMAALAVSPVFAGIDGVVDGSDNYTTLAIQDTQTNFGDNQSELDGAYGLADESVFNLALTGNLASGNAIVILFDTVAGGQNQLNVTGGGVPGYLSGQNGARFDSGFDADFAIALNRFNNDVYYDVVDISANTGAYNGTHAVGGGGALGFGQAFFDNSNTVGVTGGTGTGSGADATTGLELSINRSVLGYGNAGSSFKAMAYVSNNGNGFMSNQVLGGIGGGDNLAWGGGGSGSSQINFANIAGAQSFDVDVVPEPATMLALGCGLAAVLRRRKG